MSKQSIATILTFFGLLGCVAVSSSADAADEPSKAEGDRQVVLGDGQLTLEAAENWKREQPRVRIIDAEFQIPPAEGDEDPGRLTIMGAGGSVQQNIDRWIGQFTQPSGQETRAKIEKKQVAGQEVHFVDLAGTYKDQRGPFAPAVVRENYRMLGAIIVTEKHGQYFVKFYGPKKTVAANEEAFQKFIESLQVR